MSQKRILYQFPLILLVLVVSLFLFGCGTGDIAEDVSGETKGEAVKFNVIREGKSGFPFLKGKLNNYYVLDSERDWQNFWEEADRRSSEVGGLSDIVTDPNNAELEQLRKETDFEDQMVVGAVFERPTTGFNTIIKEVIRTDENIVVKIDVTGSGDSMSENSAPYQFVRLDTISDLPVKFELSNETNRASDIDIVF